MSITEEFGLDKEGKVIRFPLFQKLFLSLTIILVALLSFGIGRLSVVGKGEPIRIEYDANLISNSQFPISNQASVSNAVMKIENSTVIGSKNGSKYHYPHCPGAKQIKEENKISFNSPEAAETAGYSLATNCKAR